jgi:SM-20-related protein
MARAHTLSRLGLFVTPGFLDAEFCTALRNEVRASLTTAATIVNDQNAQVVNETKRKTDLALISPETKARVMSRLMHIKPALEEHFDLPLTSCQPVEFLIYRAGYHFAPHRDNDNEEAAPPWLRRRRVSVSIFLNGEGNDSDSDTYSGGSLTFYGLLKGISSRGLGSSATGEEGLLIAFRSDTVHAVRSVTRGVRYSAVTWFE